MGLLLLLFLSYNLLAQPGGGGPCPTPPCTAPVPIGGIEYLLIVGGLLGIKRLAKKK